MSIETGLVIVLLIWLVVNTLALNDLFKRMDRLSRPLNIEVVLDTNFKVINKEVSDG